MITLKSTNPKFSWILRKNPETQRSKNEPFSKSLRKGTAHGWFPDDQTFKMLFIDSPTESSFNTISDFEYLDQTRYCSPYLPIAMIGALLASAQKEVMEEDSTGFESTFDCIVNLADPKMAKRIKKTATIDIEMVQLQHHLYKLVFKTDNGIRYLLNYVISFLITQAVSDPNLYVPMDEDSFKKYVSAMNVINAPYYMRYVTALRCAKSPQTFSSLKPMLENSQFVMNHGDTQNHRWMAIQKYLQGNKKLIDIGCGELFYERRLYNLYDEFESYDADPKIQDRNKHLIEVRQQDKIKLHGKYDDQSDIPDSNDTDVLLTEVLEHMPLVDAICLLNRILSGNFNKVVVTMPNKDFNRFYGLSDDEKRHPDHHYEPTEREFWAMMLDVAIKNKCQVEFFNVGDGVENAHASLGCVFHNELKGK